MIKNIVIVGASGFIGKHLLKHYLDEKKNVLVIVPDPENLTEFNTYSNFYCKELSFDGFDKISVGFPFESVDICYYLAWAGYGKTTNDYSVQIQNIKPLCDVISELSLFGCKRVVFASSFSEFMISDLEEKRHDDDAYCNVYGSAKHAARLMGQAVAAQKRIEFVSVAFANTFGPGDKSKRSTNLFIYKLLKGEALDLTEGQHLYDWNYIDDTICGLILAGERGSTDSVYYIGNNYRKPLKQIVSEVRDILNPSVEIRLGTYKEDFYVDYRCVDVHKLYRETGYRAKTDFKEAILKTAEWVKSLNWE